MIKVKALENFWCGRFNEIKNIVRATSTDEEKHLIKGDVFECNNDLATYLLNEEGNKNPVNRALVEVIEIKPELEVKKPEPIKSLKKNNSTKKVAKK